MIGATEGEPWLAEIFEHNVKPINGKGQASAA